MDIKRSDEILINSLPKEITSIHFSYPKEYLYEGWKEEALRHRESLEKIKEYLKQIHNETQHGILSSNSLIWENIERLCDGKDILGSDENERTN